MFFEIFCETDRAARSKYFLRFSLRLIVQTDKNRVGTYCNVSDSLGRKDTHIYVKRRMHVNKYDL